MRNPAPRASNAQNTRVKSPKVSRLISIGDRHRARQLTAKIGIWTGRILLSLGMVASFTIVTQTKLIGLRQIASFLFWPVVYLGAIAVLVLLGTMIGGGWGKAIAQRLVKKLHHPLEQVSTQQRLKSAIASVAIVVLVGSTIAALIYYGLAGVGVLIAFLGIEAGIWIVAIALLLICPGFMPAILITRIAINKAIQAAFPELDR